ncbi:MAG: nicotinamide-nucleotide adenylyltransferase [Thermoplasmata archaeon]|nr:nicotinamide-nucleotide adenylyltransferase [Thermoplasmata archaeon]
MTSKTTSPNRVAPRPRGLYVGRFQPFHLGHLRVVERLRRDHPEEGLLLGIGSAQESHTAENPFTAGERMEMIERALAAAKVPGVVPVPIPDLNRHSQWVAYVVSMLPTFQRVYTNSSLTRTLFEEAGFEVQAIPFEDRAELSGKRLRAAMRTGKKWRNAVPPAVGEYLASIHGAERVRGLTVKDDPLQ